MHLFRPLLSLTLFLPLTALGQTAPPSLDAPTIVLSGRSRVTGSSTSPQPSSSSLPEQYARWEFDPTLAIYGVPISARVLLTTESDTTRHAMNSAQILFDVKAFQAMLRERVMAKAKSMESDFRARAEEMRSKLSDPAVAADLARYKELTEMESAGLLLDSAKSELEALRTKTEEARKMAETAERYASMDPAEMAKEKEKELKALSREIADPAKLEGKLQELDLMSGAEKFLFGIQDLGIGVNYPRYSPLVLSGVPVNGASLEYTLGLVTIAGAGGSMNGPIPDGRIAPETFDRNLFAGKLGLGATGSTHFHLIGLYARDDETTSDADSIYRPGVNYVLGADMRVELFDRGLVITGEGAGSMFTRDATAPDIEVAEEDDPTGVGVINSLEPKISTSVDYAWSLGTIINLFGGATRVKASAKMVGPGYTTLGVPYLRTDIFGQEGEFQQSLFSGQVTFGGYYKRNEDNILPWKRTRVGDEWLPVRTTLTSYGGRAGLQFQGLPYLQVEYAPYVQQTDIAGDSTGIDNRTTLISATAGWGYRIAGLSGSTTATALSQTGTSHDGAYAFTNMLYSAGQTIGFSFPLSLTFSGSYSETEIAAAVTRIASISGSGTWKISDVIRGTLGLSYSDRNDGGSRLGFSVRTTVKLWSMGELDLRAERNAYESGLSLDEDYEQVRLRAVLTTRW